MNNTAIKYPTSYTAVISDDNEQRLMLLPRLTIGENLRLSAKDPRVMEELIAELELEGQLDCYPRFADVLTIKKAELAAAVLSGREGFISFDINAELDRESKLKYFNYLYDVCYKYGFEGFADAATA